MKVKNWLLVWLCAGLSTLQAQVAPLHTQDVGSPALAGTAVENAGVITMEGGGADIYGSSDQFRFVYEPLVGNGALIARLTSLENTHQHAKAGVMIRGGLENNARHVFTVIHADGTAQFQRRTANGGTTSGTAISGTGFNRWLKIERSGNNFISSVSSDGVTWTAGGSVTINDMPSTTFIGLAVTSHNTASLATAVFDSATFPSDIPPAGSRAAYTRIEAESYSGQAGVGIYSGGTGSKVGSIENNTWISFNSVDFQHGAASVLARVASAANGGTIEFRLGSTSGTLLGTVAVGGTGGWNNFVNAQSVLTAVPGVHNLYLVFKGSGTSSLFDVDYIELSPAGTGTMSADIGGGTPAGIASVIGSTYTVEGNGTDIAGSSDQFHYVYKPMYGDGTMVAKLANVENTSTTAKAGLMIRGSLAANARHFMTSGQRNGDVRFLRRLSDTGSTTSSGSVSGLPRWLRIQRAGNVITSSASPDGTTWTTLGSETVTGLPLTLYVGLAVTSANPQLATAVFEQVSFPTVVDSDGDKMPDSWEIAFGLNPNSAADAGLDPDSDGLTNLQEFWALSNPTTVSGPAGGNVSIAAITNAAYERDGLPGLLRLTRSGGTAAVTVNFTRSGTATTEDYILRDPAGNVVNGTVALASGVTSLDLTVIPVADGSQEYPENLTVTLDPSASYNVGTAAATVNFYDATDIPAHEQLFVAYLTPPSGSLASGLVQMYLNGPKTSARVSVAPSNVSGQTNTYIRWGVPGGTGPELRPNLGVGTLTNVVWNIQPIVQATGQDIIDGLFQVGGKYVYVTIGMSSGQLQGVLTRRTGSINFTAPPAAPAIGTLTGNDLKRDVARFLSQATFGPTSAEIDALYNRVVSQYGGNRINAYTAWLDEQLALDVTKHYSFLRAAEKLAWSEAWGVGGTPPDNVATRNNHGRAAGSAWWCAAMTSHDQLKQRYAFALSEIFVVGKSMQPLSSFAAAGVSYYDLLGAGTSGNFRDLLENVSKSPTMGEYLSHKKNRKARYDAQGKLISSPDENYAREIMQLFSIGLVELHPDGTLKLDSTGALIPTYDNEDIANLARVFTGWSYGKVLNRQNRDVPADNADFNAGTGEGDILYSYYPWGWIYPMRNFAVEHDTGSKTFLDNTVPAGLDGEADLDAALNIIFNHPNVGPFISRLLIQRLVTSNPSPGYIYRVAQKFANNGSGVRGDMKAVIKAILLDYEARTFSVAAGPAFGKQREPIIRYIHMLRVCNATSNHPIADYANFLEPEQYNNYPSTGSRYSLRSQEVEPKLGQFPMAAPSVFNWFLPDYAPQGPIAASGLVAPEMTATSESSTFRVINFFQQITHSFGVDSMVLNLNALVTEFDALKTGGMTNQQATEAMFDKLDLVMAGGAFKATYTGAATPNPRSILIDSIGSMSETSANRMKELVYLLTSSPTYVHQR